MQFSFHEWLTRATPTLCVYGAVIVLFYLMVYALAVMVARFFGASPMKAHLVGAAAMGVLGMWLVVKGVGMAFDTLGAITRYRKRP